MRTSITVLWIALLIVGIRPVRAENLYVATGGMDTLGCGSRLEPCQSMSRAILLARDGDTVIVGAGRYDDANSDGDLGDPGDEAGPIASGCHDRSVRDWR